MHRHFVWIPPATILAFVAMASQVPAQAIGYFPVVGAFPNGATLGATPVVSADRRYVRMTLNPQFNAIEGFDPFSIPGAVSGGGGGGIGGGGAGGGAGGGFRNIAEPGGTFNAGMDGVVPAGQAFAYRNDSGVPVSDPAASAILSGASGIAPAWSRVSQNGFSPNETSATTTATRRPAKAMTSKKSRKTMRSR